jgi:hypothetical protein
MKTELFRQAGDTEDSPEGTTIFSEGQDAGGVMYVVQEGESISSCTASTLTRPGKQIWGQVSQTCIHTVFCPSARLTPSCSGRRDNGKVGSECNFARLRIMKDPQ